MLTAVIVFLARALLVALFLPFSALDKVMNFGAAVGQAQQAFSNRYLATGAILCGLAIEVVMSLAILCGIADRLAAVILAFYCVATALLWKQFWNLPDFRLRGPGNRDLFWDFWKNLALAGGFLSLAFGGVSAGVTQFAADPFGSSHPYSQVSR